MDLATILGLIFAWGALLIALMMEHGKVKDLINPSAFILVIGGTLGATVISFSLKQMLGLPGIIKNAFFSKNTDLVATINTMVEFARIARKGGILALENRQ